MEKLNRIKMNRKKTAIILGTILLCILSVNLGCGFYFKKLNHQYDHLKLNSDWDRIDLINFNGNGRYRLTEKEDISELTAYLNTFQIRKLNFSDEKSRKVHSLWNRLTFRKDLLPKEKRRILF